MAKLSITEIKVRHRYRKNLGDIESLAASIKELGLLHPIVVRPDGRLDCRGKAIGRLQTARLENRAGDITSTSRKWSVANLRRTLSGRTFCPRKSMPSAEP